MTQTANRFPPPRPRTDARRLDDAELDRELTLAAGARWKPRKELFDALFAELLRRRTPRA